MIVSISYYLRKIAAFIELDDTPTEDEINKKRNIDQESQGVSDDTAVGIRPDQKALNVPKIRRPRKLPDSKKKWNTESKTELMKDYMQKYRADGKVNETNGPKNFYVKKPKV